MKARLIDLSDDRLCNSWVAYCRNNKAFAIEPITNNAYLFLCEQYGAGFNSLYFTATANSKPLYSVTNLDNGKACCVAQFELETMLDSFGVVDITAPVNYNS